MLQSALRADDDFNDLRSNLGPAGLTEEAFPPVGPSETISSFFKTPQSESEDPSWEFWMSRQLESETQATPNRWLQAREGVRFEVLQQWEGTVFEVLPAGEFTAVLRERQAESPEEMATFSVDQVSADDLKLLAPGAVFYWSIGYETKPSGQRTLVSKIRLRRLPVWTRRDLKRVEERAKSLERVFGHDQP